MSKFNTHKSRPAIKSGPMTTTGPAATYEGGVGFKRDTKSELFLLAVTNMVGEDTFYEKAQKRDDRFVNLIRQVVLEDPAWAYSFLGWLRNKANMRSASVVFAAEAVKARLDAKVTSGFSHPRPGDDGEWPTYTTRSFIRQGMARADEPGELMAYWTSKYGKTLPKPVKRGVADAVTALFNEYSYSKYGKGDGYQLADLVDLVHPTPRTPEQGDLFKHALDVRHGRNPLVPPSLPMLQSRDALMSIPQDERRKLMAAPDFDAQLKHAGLTWEALSGWLGGALDATFWEKVIPSMGYMALLRNLRNFEKAGISKEARKAVQERLADPE